MCPNTIIFRKRQGDAVSILMCNLLILKIGLKRIEQISLGPMGALAQPLIFFYPKTYFFCDFKPIAKFWNPTITPSGRKVITSEREKERENEKKNAINSGHLVA